MHDDPELGDTERAALDRAIEDGIEDFEKGDVEDFSKVLAELRARGVNRRILPMKDSRDEYTAGIWNRPPVPSASS